MSIYGELDPMVEHRITICLQRQERPHGQGQRVQYTISESIH